jgi:hypothetical protein
MAGPLPPQIHARVERLAGPFLTTIARKIGPVGACTRAVILDCARSWYLDGYAGVMAPIAASETTWGPQAEPVLVAETDALLYAARTAGHGARGPRMLSPLALLGLAAVEGR